MSGLKESDIQLIINELSKHPQIEEAILFGSRAKGTQRNGSDVDIALMGSDLSKISLEVSAFLNQESPLPYFFDIIDYNSIDNPDLISHIDRVGKLIYSKFSR